MAADDENDQVLWKKVYSIKMGVLKKIVVFSGTGAQAGAVVRCLSKAGGYIITVPTRNQASEHAQAIASLAGVKLITANYETEDGLRKSFEGQDACYFLMNSFAIREAEEYFWTFRAYEIAVQSHLKFFIYSGAKSRYRAFGYDEKYRNSHNIVKSNISDWLHQQDGHVLPWTIVTGGVYAEMLGSLLRPVEMGGRQVFAAPVTEESTIPLVPLAHYGNAVKWALQHHEDCKGSFVQAPAFQVTWPQLANAFQSSTSQPTAFFSVSQDEWFEGVSKEMDPNMMLPPTANPGDSIAFTFRKSFGAWWNLWKNSRQGDVIEPTKVVSAYGSLEDWMKRTGYNAISNDPLKSRFG